MTQAKAYRQGALDKLLHPRGPLDGELAAAPLCPRSYVCPADQLNHAGQPKAVVPMQVADINPHDGCGVDVGSQDLSAGAFAAVD